MKNFSIIAMRVIVGWHLAFTGIWAFLTVGGYSWSGPLRCARWLFGDSLRALAVSSAMPGVDLAIAALIIVAGVLLMFGRLIPLASAIGCAFLVLQYLVNPPHFGHTGVSHVMFLDRNLVEIAMLIYLAAASKVRIAKVPEFLQSDAGKQLNRRDVIVGLASTAALAGAGAVSKALRSEPVIRLTGPAVPPFNPATDLAGLSHPMNVFGKIGDVKLSRLILGGNVIGGWAHGRDLRYYDQMVKAYHTDERVFRTFRMAEGAGVNTILTNPALMRVINRYWREEGGKIQFISDCGYAGGDLIKGAEVSIENGAALVYTHGGYADTWAVEGKWDKFSEYLEKVRKFGRPTGIGCHRLETVKGCVERGILPDFWMKTVHRIDYPTAHLGEDKKQSKINLGACDNRFVDTDRKEVFDYMATRPEPWIAFKILGAGIEHPKDAFPTTYKGGADFACVGMYDYQIVEDVNIANKVFENGLPQRQRPWCG